MSDSPEKRSKHVPKIVAGLAVAIVAAGFLLVPWTPRTGADHTDSRLVTLGQQVYAAQCASCHGNDLQGEPDWKTRKPDGTLPAPPHDETGHTWHHADKQLFEITKHGLAGIAPPGYVTKMPAFDRTLTDDEIWAVLAYIKSRWPEEIRVRQDGLNR